MDIICVSILMLLFGLPNVFASGGVFNVQHKFAGKEVSLNALKEHDSQRHRHGRFLAGVDIPLGGNGLPTGTGLYYGKIALGSPAKDYYMNVDTGSDLFWINCIECKACPTQSGIDKVKLTLYDPHSSATSSLVNCDEDFCSELNGGVPIPGCAAGMQCVYKVGYGDGSESVGYIVKDVVQYNQVSGNLQTTSANSSVTFGCGVQQSGNIVQSKIALDGILGFGQSDISMISQLASSGKVKKIFAHCLDAVKGGGIFAVGDVVQPKVQTTPLVPNQTHYNVNMESVEVGKDILQIPTDVFGTGGTIIDSGTTLAYLPEEIYEPLKRQIMSNHSDLNVYIVEESFSCFQYNGSVDDGFPTVTFHFANSLSLMVYPHEYLFQYRGNERCIGWQNIGPSQASNGMILLGDLVLSNKLVVYDLETQAIGWAEYNCSSAIGLHDEQSGSVYLVGAHNPSAQDPSSAHSLGIGRDVLLLLLLTAILQILIY